MTTVEKYLNPDFLYAAGACVLMVAVAYRLFVMKANKGDVHELYEVAKDLAAHSSNSVDDQLVKLMGAYLGTPTAAVVSDPPKPSNTPAAS